MRTRNDIIVAIALSPPPDRINNCVAGCPDFTAPVHGSARDYSYPLTALLGSLSVNVHFLAVGLLITGVKVQTEVALFTSPFPYRQYGECEILTRSSGSRESLLQCRSPSLPRIISGLSATVGQAKWLPPPVDGKGIAFHVEESDPKM